MKPDFHGENCPTCNQLVKLYKRTIRHIDAWRLIKMYKLTKQYPDKVYFHISEFSPTGFNTSSDFAKMRYCNLVEEMPNDDETKRTSGFWRITDEGKAFVENRKTVPKYALIFNKGLYGFMGPQQSISDRLGKRFNYAELMNGEAQ